MAEKQEIILEVNVSSMAQSMADARTQIEGMKRDYEKLIETTGAFEKESILAASAIDAKVKSYKQEEGALLRLKQAQQALEAEGVKNIKTYNANTHTLEQNTRVVNAMAAQYRNLSGTEAKKLAEEINRVNKVVIEQEAAIGRNYKQVGSYKDQIKQAVHELQGFSGASKVIGDMGLAFSSAGSGVKGFGAALATTGLPLIISGVNMLIDVFKEFGGIADKVEQITEGIHGAFTAFVSGGNAIEAGKQIAQLTEELQLLNDASERSILYSAQVNSAIKQLQVAARDRTKTEAERISLLELADKKAFELWQKDNKRLVDIANKEEEKFRLKHNLSEIELKTVLYDNEVVKKSYDYLTDAQIDKAREKAGMVVKLSGDEVKALIEHRIKVQQSSDAYIDIVDKNAVKENALADKQKDLKDKAALDDKARQDKLAAAKAAYLKTLDSLETEFLLNERQKLEKSFDDKKKEVTGTGQRETVLRLAIEQDKQAALDKFDADAKAKRLAAEEKYQQELGQIMLRQIKSDNDAMKELRENAAMDAELMKMKTGLTQIDIDNAWLSSNYDSYKDFYDSLKKLYSDDVKFVEEKNKKEIALEQAKYKSAHQIAGMFANLSNAIGENTAAGLIFQKIATGIQIAIDTASSISSAIAGATEAASQGGPAAPFLIAGYIASMVGTVVSAVSQASQLLNQADDMPPPPKFKFAKGGKAYDIGGKPHSQGGTPIHVNGELIAEAEADEGLFIMKRDAYQDISRLSAWNQKYGGDSWDVKTNFAALGGSLPILSDGGFVARDITRNSDNAMIIQEAIRNGFSLAPSPKLSIVELEAKQANRNRSVRISEA